MPFKNYYYVYLLTNWKNNVIYVGMTNNLYRRISEHKKKLIKGFTYKYNCNKLVYYESFNDVNSAIFREKKNTLVNSVNPDWKDLSNEW